MSIDLKALNSVLREYNELSAKPNHNAQERSRMAFLQTAAAGIRTGATMEEIDQEWREDAARRGGITLKKEPKLFTKEEELEIRSYRESFESRDTEGADSAIGRIGTYTGLGFFVPNSWYGSVVWALKAHDALFDPELVTYIKSTNSRPLPIPTPSDVENVASYSGEGGSQSEVDIAEPNHVVLGGYSFKTPRYVASMEAFEDVNDGMTVTSIFNDFSRDRLARGIGHELAMGDGSKILGLVPSLITNGAPTVTAQGAAVNDGGSEAGYNSLGSQDFANAIALLDQAYLSSPKVAWLMNRKTLANLEALVDKIGHPLGLVQYVDGNPYILGIRVRIAPSMDSIGNGSAPKYPVVLGDFAFWATRIVAGELSGVQSYTQGPGLAENGLVGLRSYLQADGAVLYQDWTNSAQSPFVLVKNAHS